MIPRLKEAGAELFSRPALYWALAGVFWLRVVVLSAIVPRRPDAEGMWEGAHAFLTNPSHMYDAAAAYLAQTHVIAPPGVLAGLTGGACAEGSGASRLRQSQTQSIEHAPGPRGSPQDPQAPAGSADARVALFETEKTERRRSTRALSHSGQATRDFPLTNLSNRDSHSRHRYSYSGIPSQ